MESPHNQKVRCGYSKPEQSRPADRHGQFGEVNENSKCLCELFEKPQDEFCQALRDDAPARKEAFEEFDHHRRSRSKPCEKGDAENDHRHETKPSDANAIE